MTHTEKLSTKLFHAALSILINLSLNIDSSITVCTYLFTDCQVNIKCRECDNIWKEFAAISNHGTKANGHKALIPSDKQWGF